MKISSVDFVKGVSLFCLTTVIGVTDQGVVEAQTVPFTQSSDSENDNLNYNTIQVIPGSTNSTTSSGSSTFADVTRLMLAIFGGGTPSVSLPSSQSAMFYDSCGRQMNVPLGYKTTSIASLWHQAKSEYNALPYEQRHAIAVCLLEKSRLDTMFNGTVDMEGYEDIAMSLIYQVLLDLGIINNQARYPGTGTLLSRYFMPVVTGVDPLTHKPIDKNKLSKLRNELKTFYWDYKAEKSLKYNVEKGNLIDKRDFLGDNSSSKELESIKVSTTPVVTPKATPQPVVQAPPQNVVKVPEPLAPKPVEVKKEVVVAPLVTPVAPPQKVVNKASEESMVVLPPNVVEVPEILAPKPPVYDPLAKLEPLRHIVVDGEVLFERANGLFSSLDGDTYYNSDGTPA